MHSHTYKPETRVEKIEMPKAPVVQGPVVKGPVVRELPLPEKQIKRHGVPNKWCELHDLALVEAKALQRPSRDAGRR
jgi:hypothetical protein